MKRNRLTVKDMAYCAICAAVLTVSAWIAVPALQISFTMQSFAVFFILGLLGGRLGAVSIGIYLLLGAVGLPVFSGFRGGVSVLLGFTGGYIWGFLAAALTYWAVTALIGRSKGKKLVAMVLGMAVCYACGTLWYGLMYAGGSFRAVIGTCVVPYLVPDGIKIGLALTLSEKLKGIIFKSN